MVVSWTGVVAVPLSGLRILGPGWLLLGPVWRISSPDGGFLVLGGGFLVRGRDLSFLLVDYSTQLNIRVT